MFPKELRTLHTRAVTSTYPAILLHTAYAEPTRIRQTHHHQPEDGLFKTLNTYGGCFYGFSIKCMLCLTHTYWFQVLLHF